MPWDPTEERWRDVEYRIGELERGPYTCPICGKPYNSRLAAAACCDDEHDQQ